MELARVREPLRLREDLEGRLCIRSVNRFGQCFLHCENVLQADGLLFACPVCEDHHLSVLYTWRVPEDVSPGPFRFHFVGRDVSDLTVISHSDRAIALRPCGVRLQVQLGLVRVI